MNIFRKNIEVVSDVIFSSDTMEKIKQKLINYLLSEKFSEKQNLYDQILCSRRIFMSK